MKKQEIKELTKAEEHVMQVLWKIKKGFVKDMLPHFPDPKPAYNTVSTIVRILEQKEFIGHASFGKTHEYFPMISREDYTRAYMKGFLRNYFSNSFSQMVSFFAKQEDLSVDELEEMLESVIKGRQPKKRR